MEGLLEFLFKTIGLGLLTGFVFGVLFKKISKVLLFIIALIVVLSLVFGFNELIPIDWLSINAYSKEIFSQFFPQLEEKLKVLLANIPYVLGLLIGFVIGLKKG